MVLLSLPFLGLGMSGKQAKQMWTVKADPRGHDVLMIRGAFNATPNWGRSFWRLVRPRPYSDATEPGGNGFNGEGIGFKWQPAKIPDSTVSPTLSCQAGLTSVTPTGV